MQGFDEMLVNVIGDVMMSAGVVAYLGAFTVSMQTDVKTNTYTEPYFREH